VRVLHLVPALFDADDGIVGGAERFAYELARHMAREVPTRLVAFGDRPRETGVDELAVRVIGNPWYVRGQRTNPIALSLLGELRRADIVHCHQRFVLASSLAALFCRLTGRRVFVTDLGGGGWDLSAYFSTDQWYHGHLHLSDFSRRGYGHAEKAFAHVIRAGVDADKFSPLPTPVRRDEVIFVGRLMPHKGIDVLIDALPADQSLEIFGRQFEQRYLTDLQRMARCKRVTFHRQAEDSEVIAAYRRALCVVLPSVNRTMYGEVSHASELLGQTLIEGMACGAPAICTAVGGMPEVVIDGATGFVVPPSDARALGERIRWLRENPDKATRMGAAGRQLVLDKFTWPRVVRRCLEIYGRAA
jgi:glycosyltransferase involved in cell wall biosynthesis